MSASIRLVIAALLAGLAAPALAGATAPQLAPMAETIIALAVAEARCTGADRATVARHRPQVLRQRAAQLRQIGRQMAAHYQQAHGPAWAAALHEDMVAARTRFETRADQGQFCQDSARQARRLAAAPDFGSDAFRGMDVEMDMLRLAAR